MKTNEVKKQDAARNKQKEVRKPAPIKSPGLEMLMDYTLSEQNLSVKELADKSGIALEYVRKIVAGKRIPARNALRRICNALKLDFYTVRKILYPQQFPKFDSKNIGQELHMQFTAENAVELGKMTPQQKAKTEEFLRLSLLNDFEKLPIAVKQDVVVYAAIQRKKYKRRSSRSK